MNDVMVLTIYDGNDEVLKTLRRSFVPWRLLKRAVMLAGKIDLAHPETMTAETVDDLAMLVVDAFGGQVTLEEIDNGADLGQMLAVMTAIMSIARGRTGNPT